MTQALLVTPVSQAQGKWGEAACKLAELVNDDTFRSLEGKSKHQLWLELCDLVTKHPADCAALRVDAILRSGIRKFTDEARPLELLRWALLTCSRLPDPVVELSEAAVRRLLACKGPQDRHEEAQPCRGRWGGCGLRWRTSTSGRGCTSTHGTCTRRAWPR